MAEIHVYSIRYAYHWLSKTRAKHKEEDKCNMLPNPRPSPVSESNEIMH